MKIIKFVLVLGLCGALCSCTALGTEPNNIAFVVAVGFDKAENDNYDVTIQFARVNKISGGESESGEKSELIQNICVEAPNIYSAIETANHIVSKKFSLSHSKLIVFSKEIAEEGIGDIIDSIMRNDEIRPDVFLAVAQSSANEYLTQVKPVIEINPAKYYQLVYGNEETGGIPKTDLQTFYFDKESKAKNSVLPLAGISGADSESNTPNVLNDNAAVNDTGGFEYQKKNYIAGEVAIVGENKSETMGMAVFEGEKMIGIMGSTECELYNILKGNMKKSYISFKDISSDKAITIKAYEINQPSYDIDLEKKEIKIKLFMEAELYSKPNEEEDLDKIQSMTVFEIEKACKEFVENARDGMNCDILNIEEKIKKSFIDNKALDKYDFKNDFINYSIDVEADMKIRRTGMKF